MEFVYIDFFSFVAAMRLGSTVKEKKVKRRILTLPWYNSIEFCRLTPDLDWNKGSSESSPIDQFMVLLEASIYSVTWKTLLPYCQRSGTIHNSNIFVGLLCGV